MLVRIFIRIGFVLAITSCSEFSKQEVDSSSATISSEEQLAQSGLQLMQQNIQELSKSARDLQQTLKIECDSFSKNEENKALFSSYKELIRKYYQFSLFSLATTTEDIFYPILNRCIVDTQVILTKQKNLLPENLHPSIKGLLAIEYLLFEKSLVSVCSPNAQPQTAEWNALSESEKRQDRCQHAIVLTEKIIAFTDALEQKWTPNNPNYQKTLMELEYTHSPKNLVKTIVQFMGNLEKSKDNILGIPLGLNSQCQNEAQKCVDKVPFVYTDLGLTALVGALQSFHSVFINLEKYLKQKGQTVLSDQLKQAIAIALRHGQKLESTQSFLPFVLGMNPQLCRETTLDPLKPNEPICLLFKQVELITDIYKTDLLTFMSLEVQSEIPQGDND